MADQDPPQPTGPRPRTGRRLLVLRATGLAGAAALTGCIQVPAGNNPYRTGVNDSDPSDGPGQGRGNRSYAPQRRTTGVSDSDPSDGPGQGRGTAYRGSSGRNDNDPNDAPGRGRGNVRRTSDSDPYDAAGQGRR